MSLNLFRVVIVNEKRVDSQATIISSRFSLPRQISRAFKCMFAFASTFAPTAFVAKSFGMSTSSLHTAQAALKERLVDRVAAFCDARPQPEPEPILQGFWGGSMAMLKDSMPGALIKFTDGSLGEVPTVNCVSRRGSPPELQLRVIAPVGADRGKWFRKGDA